MDTSQAAPDSENLNTNRNQVTSPDGSVMAMDQLQEETFFPVADNMAPGRKLEVNETVDLTSTDSPSLHPPLPSIVVSPPSPERSQGDILSGGPDFSNDPPPNSDSRGMVLYSQDTPTEGPPPGLDKHLLTTPSYDVAFNSPRPPLKEVENNSGIGLNISEQQVTLSNDPKTNEEDQELMCRYASTPVLSNSGRFSQNQDSTDHSLISLDNASPIAPDESNMLTPNRSCNRSILHDEEIPEDLVAARIQPENVMLVHPQFLVQNQVQPMLRPETSVPQTPQPPYMAGRMVDHGYLPAAASLSSAVYNTVPNVYSSYLQTAACYNEYIPARDPSWTDLSYRCDSSPVSQMVAPPVDACCFSLPTASCSSDSDYFVYPSIYVSSSGLISVLLRNDMSVEMTVDRTIRVVSHNHMMAVATDSRGTAACLYHPAVKVFQMGTATDIATLNFRARMGNDVIVFSNGINYFKLEESELQPTGPIKFTDIFRDQSVNLLFSSEGYGESLVASCMQVAAQAEYANLPKGGVIVRINGVKVTQTGGGDVTVVTGAKFIRLSPHFGTTRLTNRFVDIEVEKDWTVKLTRGSHSFVYSKKRAMVCNGKMEAGFDENNGLKVTNLQLRLPLLADPSIIRRPIRKQVRVPPSTGPTKRRSGPSGMGRGMT